jgi:hypothetical protein
MTHHQCYSVTAMDLFCHQFTNLSVHYDHITSVSSVLFTFFYISSSTTHTASDARSSALSIIMMSACYLCSIHPLLVGVRWEIKTMWRSNGNSFQRSISQTLYWIVLGSILLSKKMSAISVYLKLCNFWHINKYAGMPTSWISTGSHYVTTQHACLALILVQQEAGC